MNDTDSENERSEPREPSAADELSSRMMRLFEGYDQAYGTYDSTAPNENKGGKLEIKATARTLRKPITRDMWQDHLDGVAPLGVIPIRDNNTCLWGCIDIDQYSIEISDVVEMVEREGLPLLACRSKSGGIHLFLFLDEPVSAEVVQMRLREMAALIGYGMSEIFPKQRAVAIERGDLGSWLNMPYFGGDQTDRYGVKRGGLGMSLIEFLETAEAMRQPAVFFEKDHRKKPEKDPDWGDGPPCMQHLAAVGFPEGMRNKGLFALATFAKKKYGSDWIDVLERWNREYFDPPLPSAEVQSIVRSHEKKDYNYTCKEQPLCAHCNSGLCRTRKYGVGGDDDFPVIGGLSVLNTEPPIWFLDVENERLELTTDQLQNYRMFHKVCMERLFRCYKMVKQETWLGVVASAMRDAIKIDSPPEISTAGQFEELLESFVTDRHRAEQREELILGKPWFDEDECRYYFRMQDLQRHLEGHGFKIYQRGQMSSRIRDMGGGHQFFNLRGRGVNAWWVPGEKYQAPPQLDLPKIERDPI